MEACREACIPWTSWVDINWYDRALVVARYRMHILIDMHISEASKKDAAASAPQHSINGVARR
jgi:hypothetical protein